MLSPRSEKILKSIVGWYIERGVPVSSQNLVQDYDLPVSSATVRNEVMALEKLGYIIRPYTSSGSIPSDKGYRYYVSSLSESVLPIAEQFMINHLFHQVEGKLDEWMTLAASMIARLAHNTAVITAPRSPDCRFKHVELVSIQDDVVLMVLVLRGARIKQQLINLDQPATQEELRAVSDKINKQYADLSCPQIHAKKLQSNEFEKKITENILGIIQQEDELDFDQSYLDGVHYLLSQPEFSHSDKIGAILELLEHRSMLKTILPENEVGEEENIKVIIGSENKSEIAQQCSLVISRYGLPAEGRGNIIVLGPTRMAYPRVSAAVNYLSAVLSELIGDLYDIDTSKKETEDNN